MAGRREGMLRREFQDWYPSIRAGWWYPADELTAWVREHHLTGSPQWRPEGRIPSEKHFEFKGGIPREGSPRCTREGDRSPAMPEGPPALPHRDT
jgi:hypothetical protein